MDINRRLVLKGLGLSSIAGFAMASSPRAHTSTALSASAGVRPQLALVNDDRVGAVFLHGAVAAIGSELRVRRVGQELRAILDLQQQFGSSGPMRVIGLLDDATGTLVVDLARSAGARIQWLGQHTAHGCYSRHHLVGARSAEHCAQWLAGQLHASGVGFHIISQHQGDRISPRSVSGPQRAGANAAEWAGAIGYLLALDTSPTTTYPTSPNGLVADGHFVSFSIELGESDRG